MASNRAVRLVSLSERLARGIGPRSSRSIRGISGLLGERPGESAQQIEAGRLIDFGLVFADDRLAEQVGGERQPCRLNPRTVASASTGFSPAMNRRAMWVAANRENPASSRAPANPRRDGDGQPHPPGHLFAGLGEIFLEVAADPLGRPQGGHGVDEPEELDLDLGLAEGQVHQAVVPPRPLPGRRPSADPLEQLAADLPRPAFQVVV